MSERLGSTIVFVIVLLALAALFVILRYEGGAERGKERGELLEPLRRAILRGLREDLRSLWNR